VVSIITYNALHRNRFPFDTIAKKSVTQELAAASGVPQVIRTVLYLCLYLRCVGMMETTRNSLAQAAVSCVDIATRSGRWAAKDIHIWCVQF